MFDFISKPPKLPMTTFLPFSPRLRLRGLGLGEA